MFQAKYLQYTPNGVPIITDKILFKLPKPDTSINLSVPANKIKITTPGINAENDLLTTSGTLSGIFYSNLFFE